MEWKNRKTHWHEAVSSALNFPVLKNRTASFLMLSASKLKSRDIASLLTLSSSKNEEVSQNSFAFKLADKQIDRSIGRWMDGWVGGWMDGWIGREIDRQLQQLLQLHFTTTTTTNILRYSALITPHYTNYTILYKYTTLH